MCWMTIRNEFDALGHAVQDVQRAEESNGHSYGFAWLEDGEIRVVKGVGKVPTDWNPPVTDIALGHTRYATKGNITEFNAHPFEIEDPDGNVVAAFAHNGTWYGAPNHDKYSDTWFMARELEDYLEEYEFENALSELARKCGETFTVLRDTGDVYAYHGRFTITRQDTVIASSGYGNLPEQTIVKLSHDGDVDKFRVNTPDRTPEWTEPRKLETEREDDWDEWAQTTVEGRW